MPPSNSDKLRIIFRNKLRKGYIKNAELNPSGNSFVLATTEINETLIVRGDCRTDTRHWFTDRRLLREDDRGLSEVLRYETVRTAHWMFTDLPDRMKRLRSPEDAEQLKAAHYDRIEIELKDGRQLAINGLSDSYAPKLRFLQWITRA